MKLFWKMFLSIISIITILFSAFGGWLLYATFNTSLDREMSRGNSENKMFLYAFEASLEMLPDYSEDREAQIEKIADAIKQSIGQNQYFVKIYNDAGKAIYQDSELKNTVSIGQVKRNTYTYIVNEEGGRHYLEMMMGVQPSF